jgi:putative nucleotidyltransferase with HDIG domain
MLDLTAVEPYHPSGGQINDRPRSRVALMMGTSLRIHVYAGVLALAASAVAFALIASAPALDTSLWAIAVLVALAIVAERQSVRISPNTEMSIAALPILFAAVVYEPYVAMVVGGGSVLLDLRKPYARWVIWTSSRALTAAAAGVVAQAVLTGPDTFSWLLLAVVAGGLTEGVCDVLLNAVTVAVRGSGSFRATVKSMSRLLLCALPLYAPTVAALAYAYQEISPWAVGLFAVPAIAAQSLLILYQDQRNLTASVVAANERLERASVSFAAGLVAALDARDHDTAGHSATVGVYSREIARHMELCSDDQRLAHLAGLLHDIGKVGLPPGILEKSGPLTPDERREMEQHSAIGERILRTVDDYHEIARIVRHHHERFDGTGYPDGLAGDTIPLLSRIVAVADAYSAMTSARSYRDALPKRVARVRLREGAGTQFDESVVRAFEEVLGTQLDGHANAAASSDAEVVRFHGVLESAVAMPS